MRELLVLVCVLALSACSVGGGYLFDTDRKCRVLHYGEGGSGTINTPYVDATIQGPGSFHVIGEGCANVPLHPPEETP